MAPMRHFGRPHLVLLGAVVFSTVLSAQRGVDPLTRITEADLRRDLFALAGDETRGREGGTIDELAASVWLAERAREAGLQPAGDGGTYFQFFPLERFRVSASSVVRLGGQSLRLGRDVVTDAVGLANVSTTVSPVKADAMASAPLKGTLAVVTYEPAPAAANERAAGPGAARGEALGGRGRTVNASHG